MPGTVGGLWVAFDKLEAGREHPMGNGGSEKKAG